VKNSPVRLQQSLLNLSVEEENLGAIPFAVLERRVGKKIGKLELNGTKILPDGTEMRVSWQVQGNNDLGLPTEQDLDIFVALGVLTFRASFAKTISFTGREIARILNISGVHGKFYQRLKLAMDRFIPLRFRALTATDRQEDVKWCNVFQEASFSLDRATGRCTGTVTWTDKLIQSMDNGFFRLLDAGRYMELDGITAKHLYRFLAVAYEKTDLLLIDARKLATEHLGILTPPKYLSRLMQTLEPAFEQLIRAQVMGTYHVVSSEEWTIALHRHPAYVPERKTLLLNGAGRPPELSQGYCQEVLLRAGFTARETEEYVRSAKSPLAFYTLERAGHLLEAMREEEVLPHVAMSTIRRGLDAALEPGQGIDLLDWCEIAIEVCRHKKANGQKLKNAPGLIVKIIKDTEMRGRLVSEAMQASEKQRFRQREQAFLHQQAQAEERILILEYEQYRQDAAAAIFESLPDNARQAMQREKADMLGQYDRFQHLSPARQAQEIQDLILQEIARKEPPSFEKWLLRKRAGQAALPFGPELPGARIA
jgi:hypothetical protein